jgi:hypothetical protein
VSVGLNLEKYIKTLNLSADGEMVAALARNLAASLDDPDTAAYAKPNLTKQFREVVAWLERTSSYRQS